MDKLTSPEGDQVAYAESLGLVEMCPDGVFGQVAARDVQHSLQLAVLEHGGSCRHAAGRQVTSGVASRVPRDVTEQRLTFRHSFEPNGGKDFLKKK